MASSSFMSENQSFSEANSSWASLVVDHVQNSFDDEDYSNILDFDSDVRARSASVDPHSRSKQHVDLRTFEQVLQVLVQQGATLDSLRAELDQERQERRQESEYRDARLRLAEKELRSLRADKQRALESLEALSEECATLKAASNDYESSELLSRDEHDHIISRIKDDARARVENVEAEKSHLTIQLSRLQIQVAQLRNQVDNRTYPEEVMDDLTKTLRSTIIETCQNADIEARAAKESLALAEERLSTLEREVDSANMARQSAEARYADIEREYDELHSEHDSIQERLAILESTQGQPDEDEAALKDAQEQAEQLKEQLREVEKAKDVALSECERLSTLFKEAEEKLSASSDNTQEANLAALKASERASAMQKELDEVVSERDQLRSNLSISTEKEATLIVEVEKLRKDLLVADEEHEREAERISKEIENELRIAKGQIDELVKDSTQRQEELESSLCHLSELKSEILDLKASFAETLVGKERIANEATSRAQELQRKLAEEKQRVAALESELAKITNRLAEQTNSASSNLEEARASFLEADESRKQAEARLKELEEKLQNAGKRQSELEAQLHTVQDELKNKLMDAEKDRSELEARLRAAQNELEEKLQDANKDRSAVEAQLKSVQDELESARRRQSQVESELNEAFQSKEAELKKTKEDLHAQIDQLRSVLKDAEAEISKGNELRNNMEEAAIDADKKHAKEIKRLESQVKALKERATKLEALHTKDRDEVESQQERIDQLEKAVREARKEHHKALRESERDRLLYAEAEGNRAEADLLNEELQQKISELGEEAKKVPQLESDLKSVQVQLTEAIETMYAAKEQASKHLSEANQLKAEIADLRAEIELLTAARRQMAAIYGLPSEPINTSRRTPTRIVSSVPRSSLSLSPSTSSTPQTFEQSGPPMKRRRVSKLSLAHSSYSGGSALGSSPTSAIFLEDGDERSAASPPTPNHRDHKSANDEIPKHIIDVYSSFAKLASLNDGDKPVCGFCSLYNRYHKTGRRPPLNFTPSAFPITFWNHCLVGHKDALRPDIDALIKAEGSKPATECNIPVDHPDMLAKLVSWKKSELAYVCGLCEIEKGSSGQRQPLGFDPSADSTHFLRHCQAEHRPFWEMAGAASPA